MKKYIQKITVLLTCISLMISISSKVYANSNTYNDNCNYSISLYDIDDRPVIPFKNRVFK